MYTVDVLSLAHWQINVCVMNGFMCILSILGTGDPYRSSLVVAGNERINKSTSYKVQLIA